MELSNPSSGTSTGGISTVLVSIVPTGEQDALVNFFSPDGALGLRARGLRKAQSKLAPRLQPADELRVQTARGRGAYDVLTGVDVLRPHWLWREELDLLALYWFFAECAFAGSGEERLNRNVFQLLVNLLRNVSGTAGRFGAAAVFCLKLLMLHGLMPDIQHCMVDGHVLAKDEPAFFPLSGEGVIGRDAYNRHYARTGGGLLRLAAERLAGWRALATGQLLEYTNVLIDATDAAILVQLTERMLGDATTKPVRSAEFLLSQWRLPDMGELLRKQES
jgi:DNA repair protein RecO